MKNYDGLFHSTYTEQLPFGPAIVRGAYDEGYDWVHDYIWEKCYKEYPLEYRCYLGDGNPCDSTTPITPLTRVEFEDFVKTKDWEVKIPSEETMVFMRALDNGTPRPYSLTGEYDKNGLFDTSTLANDAWSAIWDGAYDGYISTIYECAEALNVDVKEREE